MSPKGRIIAFLVMVVLIDGNPQGRDMEFLESVFNFAPVSGPYNVTSNDYALDATASIGTAFASGPATLGVNVGDQPVNTGTLPPGTEAVYHKYVPFSDDTAVALIPYAGHPSIEFLSYNWNDGGPNGTQDSGWNEVLDLSFKQLTTSPTQRDRKRSPPLRQRSPLGIPCS